MRATFLILIMAIFFIPLSYAEGGKNTYKLNKLFFTKQKSKLMRTARIIAHQLCRNKGFYRGHEVETKNFRRSGGYYKHYIVKLTCTNDRKLGRSRRSFTAIRHALPPLKENTKNHKEDPLPLTLEDSNTPNISH